MKYLGLVLSLTILFSCQVNAQQKRTPDKIKPVEILGYNVGDKVDDFSLKNIDDKMVSLADYKGAEGFIVIFSCNHCPFSIAYEDRINDLQEKYAAENITTVMINPNDEEQYPDDSFENMKIRAEEKEFKFPYLRDETQQVAQKWGATRTPHVFLLNADLELVYIGAIDDSARNPDNIEQKYLEGAITSMQQGHSANPYKTKAVGCSIKWKMK